MFRFENPTYLYLLLTIPALILLYIGVWVNRRKKFKKIGDPKLVSLLMPDFSVHRKILKTGILLTALAVLIIMLARPQMGAKINREERVGIESIIAMDISNSMYAKDVTPSRLDKSKMLVEDMVDNFTNDKIGLVVFAGDAFIQLPITSDYVSAKMFLADTSPSLINTQGTDIALAIEKATVSFTQAENVGRAIIVITDGEEHDGDAEQAAKEAYKKGIKVYVLGVGSPSGSPIEMPDGSYLKDRSGQVVVTHLNEDMCRRIAKAGGGAYIHVDNTNDATEKLNDEISKLQKGHISSTEYSSYDEQFQAFGIIAILLLIIEVCIMERKTPLQKRIRLFKK